MLRPKSHFSMEKRSNPLNPPYFVFFFSNKSVSPVWRYRLRGLQCSNFKFQRLDITCQECDICSDIVFLSTDIYFCYKWLFWAKGIVPAMSPGDKSHRVNWPLSLQSLVAGTSLVLATSPTNSKLVWIFWTIPCDLFIKTLRVNCSWDKSLRPVPSCKLCRGLVAETSRRD